ncbi:MAG: ABC transporter permease [Actinomycetota bacterium]|nr:ABC transporter permease [Actinomycetota bacterium]
MTDGPATALPLGPVRLRRLVRSPGGGIGAALSATVVVAAAVAGWIAPGDPFASVAPALQPPSSTHLLGTDDLGRDLFTAVVHGLRTSLLVAIAVATVAGAVGVTVGGVAGYVGGLVDDALMRATELVQVVPRFFLAVVVIALWGPGMDHLILLLGLTSWTWTARIVRAETYTLREREFVDAARSLGGSHRRIVVRHVLPNALPPTVVMLSVVASSAILIEAGLGFVGLGDPQVVSLGSLASDAQRFLRSAWWMALFPGVAIVITIVGINLLGDELNDLLDPRLGR